MNLIFRPFALAFACVCATTAVADIDPSQFNLNKNETFEANEIQLMRRAIAASPNPKEKKYFQTRLDRLHVLYPNDKPVPIKEIKKYPDLSKCTKDRLRFILRKSISDAALIGCQAIDTTPGAPTFDAIANGASLSFSQDYTNDDSTLSVSGAIGFVIPGYRAPKLKEEGATLTEAAYMVYVEADGTTKSSPTDPGSFELGAKAQLAYSAPGIPRLGLNYGAYYLTDLDFTAEGYGARISVVPFSAKARLNSYVANRDGSYWRFVFQPGFDFLHVETAGQTGLTSGDGYLWAGGDFGVEAFLVGRAGNGSLLKMGVKAFDDLQSSSDAVDFYAQADFFLNPKKTSLFRIDYRNGKPRNTLVDRETLTVGIGFAF